MIKKLSDKPIIAYNKNMNKFIRIALLSTLTLYVSACSKLEIKFSAGMQTSDQIPFYLLLTLILASIAIIDHRLKKTHPKLVPTIIRIIAYLITGGTVLFIITSNFSEPFATYIVWSLIAFLIMLRVGRLIDWLTKRYRNNDQ